MKSLLLAAVAMTAAALPLTVTSPAHAAGTVYGCPYGAVCVYPENAGWNGSHPSLIFYSYGAHNLSNQLGRHYVLNNQYGALAYFCDYYGPCGSSSNYLHDIGELDYTWEQSHQQGFSWKNVDLTPVDAIDLVH